MTEQTNAATWTTDETKRPRREDLPTALATMPNQRAQASKRLWTRREAAAAMRICERTLWTLTDPGRLTCIRIGRAVRYDPEDVYAWIRTQKTASPPPELATEEP